MTTYSSGAGPRRSTASAAGLVVVAAACGGGPTRQVEPPPQAPADDSLSAAAVIVTSSRDGAPRPVVRRHNYLLEFGPYSAEIDPVDGACILAFSLGGRSVIVPREESPEAYGSTLWTSPQSDWQWPPPPEIASAAWNAEVEGSALVLTSATSPKLHLSAKQRIWGDSKAGALVIEVSLRNHGSETRRAAPWQNTRVRPGGLTFYAGAEPAVSDAGHRLEPAEGIVWLEHEPRKVTQSYKLFGDGNEGWIAQVDGDLVFVKVFPDVPPGAQATGEAEIEIYVHGSGKFVEVEQQGSYVPIAPGAESHWTVEWLVRKLPRGLEVRPGSADLVRFVRDLVQGATASSARS